MQTMPASNSNTYVQILTDRARLAGPVLCVNALAYCRISRKDITIYDGTDNAIRINSGHFNHYILCAAGN